MPLQDMITLAKPKFFLHAAVVCVIYIHAVLTMICPPRWAWNTAGRPVFTAHGSEHALAGFMAIIDAMMSFVKDRGDALRSMR